MVHVPVTSSLLQSVAYDSVKLVLQAKFTSGTIYNYFDVPPDIYKKLLAAESKGSYFIHEVRDCFEYEKEPVGRRSRAAY
jgi:lysyl-tRNA synthetase class 2